MKSLIELCIDFLANYWINHKKELILSEQYLNIKLIKFPLIYDSIAEKLKMMILIQYSKRLSNK
jgi:hypothetical protein